MQPDASALSTLQAEPWHARVLLWALTQLLLQHWASPGPSYRCLVSPSRFTSYMDTWAGPWAVPSVGTHSTSVRSPPRAQSWRPYLVKSPLSPWRICPPSRLTPSQFVFTRQDCLSWQF